MSDFNDDNSSASDCSTDLGGLVNRQIDQSEISKGKVKVFGRTINVGPGQAEALRSAVQTITDNIAFEGAKYARSYSIGFAKALKTPEHTAEKVGNWVDVGWRFGLPVTNFLLGIRTSIGEGHKQMSKLAADAGHVLAANNKHGVGGILSTEFSTLQYERQRVFNNGKKNILSNIGGLVSSIPGVFINYWAWRRDSINDPQRPLRELSKNYTPEEHQIALEKSQRLLAMKDGTMAGTLSSPDSIQRFLRPKSLADFEKNISQSRIVGPILGGLLGQFVVGDIEKNNKNESAWQKIQELRARMASEEPESGSDIEDSVRAIFMQHAKDMCIRFKMTGRRFDNIVEEVSKAIVNDNLHPEALVELLDNKQIISYSKNGITYGNITHVNHAISHLVEKYAAKIDQKAFYKNAPFTPKDAVAALDHLTEEEKPFYAMLFPAGILENAGANHTKLAEYREIGKQYFVDEVTTAVENLLKAGAQDLARHGINNEMIEELEDIRKDFSEAARKGRPNQYVMEHREDVNDLVRRIVLTNKKPEGLWQDYIKSGAGRDRGEPGETSMSEKYKPREGDDKPAPYDGISAS